jgi:cytochrome c oxidase subunit III
MAHGGAEVVAGFDMASKMHRAKFGMWLFLASEIMFFSGFIGAYIALRNAMPGSAEDASQLNTGLALVNTVVLILSSLTMALAVAASKRGDQGQLQLFLVLTFILACGFLVIKSIEYYSKFSHGLYPSTSPFFGTYYLLTGFHGLHVIGGMVVLWHILTFAFSEKYNATYNIPIETFGLYWHFVDVVWIFLFPMLYLIK